MEKKVNDFENYLALKGLAPNTIRRYMDYYKTLSELLSKIDISQEVINSYLNMHHNTQSVRSVVKNYLDYTRNRYIIIPAITGRPERKKPHIMTKKELYAVRDYLYDTGENGIRNGIMLSLSYECALRRNELLTITSESFDWEGWVENQEDGCKLKVYGKGRKERYVIVPPKLMHNILLYAKKRVLKTEGNDTFFGIKRTSWDTLFSDACKKVLGKHFKLHEIRMSKGTHWWKEDGLDIVQIKNRLGHKNISTTQLYINPEEEQELDAWMQQVK